MCVLVASLTMDTLYASSGNMSVTDISISLLANGCKDKYSSIPILGPHIPLRVNDLERNWELHIVKRNASLCFLSQC
jgi:hypothetical protein